MSGVAPVANVASAANARTERPPRRRRYGRIGLYVVALIVLAIIIVPLLFAVFGGFSSNTQLAANPVALPHPWTNANYRDIAGSGSFWAQVRNSIVIAVITASVVLPAASMAGFVLARYRFRFNKPVYLLFTMGLLFPVAVAILPLFIVLRQIHLLNNPLGVALPQAAFALPISIVIIRPFFEAIPNELQDAAAIDGCTPLSFYWRVMLPLSRPVLSTVAVLSVVASWNAFLLPLLVLPEPGNWTLPIGVNNISAQYSTDTARVLAYTAISMIPALVFYAFAERQIVAGLTAGAVKE